PRRLHRTRRAAARTAAAQPARGGAGSALNMRAATATASLLAPLRGRLKAWALRRQGRDALPLRLTARRVYILPTTAGWTFALLLGVMFIAGMNYGNGLALLFTFWLAGFALVAMVMTQRVLTTTRITAAT